MTDRRFGRVEIRTMGGDDEHKDDVDEICIYDEHGRCIFHLETMDDNEVWAAAYDYDNPNPDARVVFGFGSATPIRITTEDD